LNLRETMDKSSSTLIGNETFESDEERLTLTGDSKLQKDLKERHMIMIALGGTIGTGLFLAAGQALSTAGPAGALISYLLISVMVYFVMTSLGLSFLFVLFCI